MALTNTLANTLLLELGGQPAGALRSAQPASVRVEMVARETGHQTVVRSGVRVALGEMQAQASLQEPGPLADWLAAALAGDLAGRDGAVLVADRNNKLLRRIGFRGARLSSLAWTPLDAQAAKVPVGVSLRWLVDAVDDRPRTEALQVTASRRKPLLASNFRISGLPIDAAAVPRVDLPGLQVAWSSARTGPQRGLVLDGRPQLGPLAITVGPRQADAARTWVHKLLDDGATDEAEGVALQVDLLDATMKKVQASFQLQGCLLLGMDEDPLGAGDRTGGVVLRFDVAGMKFSLV